jgi:hypothetical protein
MVPRFIAWDNRISGKSPALRRQDYRHHSISLRDARLLRRFVHFPLSKGWLIVRVLSGFEPRRVLREKPWQ